MRSRTIRIAVLFSLPASAALADTSRGPAPPRGNQVIVPDVVGGDPVPDGKWPDAAAIYFGDSQGCTGVLVAPDVVLTAGHCAGGITAVKLGTNDLDKTGEVIPVARTIRYPDSWNNYDISVLLLTRASTVTPRTIAHGCILERYLADGAPVAIVGYGAVDAWGEKYISSMMEAFTTITDADCSELQTGCNEAVSPGGELGAGGNGIDACFGDSGGPLYLLTEKGDFVVGLTSRSYDDVSPPCALGGIYVRPDAVIDWIEEETGRTLPEALCNLAPQPTAGPIEVAAGDVGTTLVQPHDPDAGDHFVYALTLAPEHGEVTMGNDGTVEFRAADDYDGEDHFVVTVTDDGDPALSGQVDVLVTILGGSGGCGCRVGNRSGAGGGALLLVLAVVIGCRSGYRRRRGADGAPPAQGGVRRPGDRRAHRLG